MGTYHYSHSRGEHRGRAVQTRHAVALVAIGAALLGACTLDTEPMSPVTRAPLEADSELDETEVAGSNTGAAGAPAEPPAPSAAIVAARVEPPEADEPAQEAPVAPPPKPAEETKPADMKDAEATPMAAADKPKEKTRCRPGKYTGVINGSVTLTGLIEVGTMAGTIDLELVPYEDRTDVLTVRHGRVGGVDDKQSRFSADLTGLVNCASGEVAKTSVERGMFEDRALDLKVGFAGAAKGQYSMDPPALVGTWQINDDTLLFAGEGTWSATMAEAY